VAEEDSLTRRESLRADGALLLVSFIWGSSFSVMKLGLDHASPLLFLTLRFTLAALLTVPFLPALRGTWARHELMGGLLLGALLAAAFAVQGVALNLTTPSRSAFLTSFYVVLVPLLSLPLTGHRPRRTSWLGALLALGGLAFMTLDGGLLRWQPGDLLTLAGALGFALHILGVGVLTGRHDFRRLYVLQIFSATVLLALFTPLEQVFWQPGFQLLWTVILTGGLATGLTFYIQNRVQRYTSASRTAVIFSMEPVFAALVAAMMVGGRSDLTLPHFFGAFLIFLGLITSSLGSRSGVPQDGDPAAGPRRRTAPSP
jgi:drug/metabolite transporter (DMT)-like permease